MIEILRHIFGVCSDSSSHPSILPLLLSGGVGFAFAWSWLKSKFIHDHNNCEECHKEEKEEIRYCYCGAESCGLEP